MGLVFKMYANESKGGKYPHLTIWEGASNLPSDCRLRSNTSEMTWNGPSVFPEYLSDYKVTVCPSAAGDIQEFEGGRYNFFRDLEQGINPCRFSDSSYIYLGYAISDNRIYVNPALRNDPNNALANIRPEALTVLGTFLASDPTIVGNSVVDNDVTADSMLSLIHISEPTRPY